MSTDLYERGYDPYQAEAVSAPPTVRITASYPGNIVGCPEVVTVDLNDTAASTLGLDIRSTIQALAAVGGTALSLYGR